MSAKEKSLWPSNIAKITQKAPVTLIKEQAALLGESTQNIVIASVTPTNNERDAFAFHFWLTAVALGGYKVRLFSIHADLTKLYPITLVSNFLSGKGEYGTPLKWEVENEGKLEEALSQIFTHEVTVKAIQAMLAQSEGLSVPEEPLF